MTLVLTMLTIIGVIISLISKTYKIPGIYQFLKFFDRPEDMQRLPGKGAIYFFLGSALSLLLFGKNIASAAIIILAVGDSMTYIIGKPFGKIKTPLSDKKLLEGAIAGWVLATAAAMLFVNFTAAVAASFTAMLVEFMDLGKRQVNDNFLIPIISGIVLVMLV